MGEAMQPAEDEITATIEDFFSDEKESGGSSSDEDDDLLAIGDKKESAMAKRKKRKKKPVGPASCLPNADISANEFREYGKGLVDFIADYIEGTRDRPVNHQAIPGWLFKQLSKNVPREPSKMDEIYEEINNLIIPGLPQWQSPKHHALLPAGGSYASLLGSMLCDGFGCIGFSWGDCPSATELEMVVMNWLAQLLDLPMEFRFFGKGNVEGGGGGIIQGTTTEALLTITVAAKRTMMEVIKQYVTHATEPEIQDRLMMYCSEQAHPGLERVAEVAGIRLKRLWTDKEGIMHSDTVRFAIEKDKQKGYFPFLVVGTVGTVASTSVDQIGKIGPLLNKEVPKIWFHIEAGYAGSSFICREYQPLLHGVDFADSFSIAAHKWLPIHMDCACLWVKKISNLTMTFACEDPEGPLYIPADDKNTMADYRQWGLTMTRRFRAMKLWMVFKMYGVKGLQQKIREDVRRAKELEKMIGEDHRFEIMGDAMFGLIAFRCKRPDLNDINQEILKQINRSAVIKMNGARVGRKYWLRFVVAGRYTDPEDVKFSWEMIRRTTSRVVEEYTERQHMEDRFGLPNYKHVITIGRETRLDEDISKDTESAAHTESLDHRSN